MFCTNCGANLPEGTRFCTRCGMPVGDAAGDGAGQGGAPVTGAAPVPEAAPAAAQVPPQPASWAAGQASTIPPAQVPPQPASWTAAQPASAPSAQVPPQPAATPPAQVSPQTATDAPTQVPPQPASDAPAPQPPKKRVGKAKVVAIVVGIIALVAIIGAGGYLVYQNFFATGPEEVIREDLDEHLAAYSDPSTGDGDRLLSEADDVLSGLAAYPYPSSSAYEAWLEDTSYTVDDVVVSDDGATATATATITHAPLISFIEHHEGEADDPGEPQETTLELTYTRNGSTWKADGDELRDAVFAAYLPSDEELIVSDVDTYFKADDDMRNGFIMGLESGSSSELDQLGITADEFADAYLDGYAYEVGDVTVDGDTASVEVSVTIKSYADIMAAFQDEFDAWAASVDTTTMTEDEAYRQAGAMMLDVIAAAEPKTTEATLTFTQDSGGVWWMDSSSEHVIEGMLGY